MLNKQRKLGHCKIKTLFLLGQAQTQTQHSQKKKDSNKRRQRSKKMAGAAGIRRKMPQRPPPPPSVLPPRPSNTLPRRPFYVDREKTCPLLLRVFTKVGSHHSREDFAVRGQEPKNEFQIYTWKDATLRELTDLVKEVTPAARRRDARLSFAFVFPEKQGHLVVRLVGKTFSYGSGEMDDGKALAQLGFQIGDYLDVAIF
ncbi:histone deacetylase complex subunit SAP18-like [Chenopodium quinoa]|uniref:histone deacetylase complex subunit SAP18-like n=1 Tax=Chenopodium quinoa TaxID=63459 RepID=UPI000B77D74D|nr:histone deacetylase complex subunit SAP18-like [Chenopodium quinoa]